MELPGGSLEESPGATVGRYKLLQRIGEGGFGVVFMAEQREPVVRRVALKVIKLGMDTRQVIARFEAERQALALMDHPHIAKVFDAGVTEAGRPYFVMELCAGAPITKYADEHKLAVRQRLQLFMQLCHAVQHAHQKGIIHRDLKPSNVLVYTLDGKPHAKVIDFGIAKATSARLTERTLFTEHKQLLGTPQYMSPEQACGNLDIDTRTDVYSLGVMLYELLTGETPFDPRSLRDVAYDELIRIIREVDPPKPSTRLKAAPDRLSVVAAQRRVEPRKLGLLVRGDLDWIAMKCLEKDRARRYETANGLALDVARYLDGSAVLAAPPGAWYRVRKFVRRNKGAVAAGMALVAALALGGGGTSLGLLRVTHAKEDLKRANASLSRINAELDHALAAERIARDTADAEARWATRVVSVLANPFHGMESVDHFSGEWEAHIRELSASVGADDLQVLRQEGVHALWGWTSAFQLALSKPSADDREKLKYWGQRIELAYSRLKGLCEPDDPLWSGLVNNQIQWLVTGRGEVEGLTKVKLSSETARQVAPLYDEAIACLCAIHGPVADNALRIMAERAWIRLVAGQGEQAEAALQEYVDRRRQGGEASLHLDMAHEMVLSVLDEEDVRPELYAEFLYLYYTDCLPLYARGGRADLVGQRYSSHLKQARTIHVPERATDSLAFHLSHVALEAGAGLAAVGFVEPVERRLKLALDDSHPHLLAVRRQHARALLAAGRFQEAEAAISSYLDLVTSAFGAEHSLALQGSVLQADLQDRTGDPDAARATYARTIVLACAPTGACRSVLREVLAAAIDIETGRGSTEVSARLREQLMDIEEGLKREPRNLGFEVGDVDTPPDGWFGDPPTGVAPEWDEFTYVTEAGATEGERCAVLAGLEGGWQGVGKSFRNLMQTFDAVPYRGRRIRFSAAVRVRSESETDGAQLWLRVDSESNAGFPPTMSDRRIRSPDWQRYEIEGLVDAQAKDVNIGILVYGDAVAWMDAARVELIED